MLRPGYEVLRKNPAHTGNFGKEIGRRGIGRTL